MVAASRQQVLQSTHQWLQPLVHVLLTCGITWREFSDLTKTTYVDVASKQFGKRGRPTNVSRTGVATTPQQIWEESQASGNSSNSSIAKPARVSSRCNTCWSSKCGRRESAAPGHASLSAQRRSYSRLKYDQCWPSGVSTLMKSLPSARSQSLARCSDCRISTPSSRWNTRAM